MRRPAPLLLLLSPALLAFLPWGEGVQVGPDAPHLDRTPQIQAWLSAKPAAQGFRADFGDQIIRWDERNGTVRTVRGAPVPAEQALQYAQAIASLSAVPAGELVFEGLRGDQSRSTWSFSQVHQGAPVEGAGLELHAQGGRIHFAMVHLHRVKLQQDPEPGQVIVAVDGGHVPAFRHADMDGVRFVDAQGQIVHAWTERRPLDIRIEERTVGDPLIDVPARDVKVSDADGSEQTDHAGIHGREVVTVALDGSYLTVLSSGQVISVPDVDDELIEAGADISWSAGAVQHHTHVVRDWLELRRPTHPWLDDNIPATVDISTSCCNAFYTSGTINFYVGGGNYNNLGRIADVVYHEYGHGVHHYVLEGGTFAGDVSEGSADYVAATILEDPILAPEATLDGGYIREIDTDKFYPDDVNGSVHNDGQIWSSFLWNLRTQWIDDLGQEDGIRQTDELFLQALSYGPTLTDLYEAVLVADDDNGDLSDGTPNACELQTLLEYHGLGGGPLSAVVFEHAPLESQRSDILSYAVDFTLLDLTAECVGTELGDARVVYAVNPEPGTLFEDLELEAIEVSGDGPVFSAQIPRQFPGTHILYGVEWSSTDDSVQVSSHGDRSESLYSFWVGDQEPLWCADFEGDVQFSHSPGLPGQDEVPEGWSDQWEVGAPEAQIFNPSGPYAGAASFGTAVTGEGQYLPSNGQHALSPELSLEDANDWMLLLTARRFLTVEDGIYDRAKVVAQQGESAWALWENPATPDGIDHTLDTEWTEHTMDLSEWRDLGPMQFAWTLTTDQGLEFGGWGLDEVCVTTLADIPRHYRVQDLAATDDAAEITISWTNPYMPELLGAVLLRSEDGIPQELSDGEIVDFITAPEPGAAHSVVDPLAVERDRVGYALFILTSDSVYQEPVEGENADYGAIPAPPDPQDTGLDSDPPGDDTGEATTPPVEKARCGCSAVDRSGPGWLGLGLLVLLRRRRW